MGARPDTIEQKVMTALRQLDDDWESIGSDDPSWTRAVKNVIGGVGKNLGYEVYAAQSDFEAKGEWVFDLSWFEEKGDLVVDMPLVLESEWNPPGILEDFQKLLISRGLHRVMVCWQPTPQAWRQCLSQLITQIRSYRGTQEGDRYLLCCWIEDPEELSIELHVAGSAA